DLLISSLSTLMPAYRARGEYDDDDISRSTVGDEVRANMVTLGTQVRVERPDGSNLYGRATGLDAGGDLIIDNDISVSAGDVHHLRPAGHGTATGTAAESGGRR
ncbi:MAG: biotin--[acetyl-CoA-carboxylase] ligase, partial [Brevibacterium sp.]|nr:biotin--[acetyl-CoA-carboxylase] ligase [Brevibacterium sp.]